jgi:glutamine synthetase
MEPLDDDARLLARLRGDGVETVVLAGSDTHGLMRGKRLPIGELQRVLDRGLAICDVFWVMHIDESDLVPRPTGHRGYFPSETEGYPDIYAHPDRATARAVPWHPATALLLCDWRRHGAEPVPISPRQVLRGVVERARSAGLEPACAVELEFYLLRETGESVATRRAAELRPLAPRPSTYGVTLGSRQEPIARVIREAMLGHGLPIEACNPETGPGQFEINLGYRGALEAADDAFLFKAGVKELAHQHDLLATFMAKPHSDWAGNSCHIHLSLAEAGGSPVFFDPDADDGISGRMRHFIGGMLAAMPELTAVMAPTPNSYRRFVPYSWAATSATWGLDNRSTGVRAICEGASGTRVEQRQAGGDVNPYLAVAAALAGGLHGIEHGIEPPPRYDGDAYAAAPGSLPELPAGLGDALDRLEAGLIAREWLGEDFVAHFVALKRAEVEAERRAVTDWEVARYLEAV